MTVHQEECKELKAKINRLNLRRTRGGSAADYLNVSTDLVEDLIADHEALDRLLTKHPELRREEPYS